MLGIRTRHRFDERSFKLASTSATCAWFALAVVAFSIAPMVSAQTISDNDPFGEPAVNVPAAQPPAFPSSGENASKIASDGLESASETHSIMVPKSPTLKSFTQTKAMEQDPPVVLSGSGEDAVGTFATSNRMLTSSSGTVEDAQVMSRPQPETSPQTGNSGGVRSSLGDSFGDSGRPLAPITQNGLRGSTAMPRMPQPNSNPQNSFQSRSSSPLTPSRTAPPSSPAFESPSSTRMGQANAADSAPKMNGSTMRGSNIRSSFPNQSSGVSPTAFAQPVTPAQSPTVRQQPSSNSSSMNLNQSNSRVQPQFSGNSRMQANPGARQPNYPSQSGQAGQPGQYPSNRVASRPAPSASSMTQPALTTQKVDTTLAKQLIQRFDVAQAPTPLPGKATSLLDVMRQVPVQKRRAIVMQYWETYYDWANLLSASDHLKALNQIQQPTVQAERGMLSAARQAAQNQVLANEIQLGKSQSKLQEFLPRGDGQLPLPSDLPLISRYETHYDWYDQRGLIPPKLRGINDILPKSLQLITNRANTVRVSRGALSQANAAYQQRKTPLASVLEAARMARYAEQDLLASVTSYNQGIGDYLLTVLRQYKSPEEVVAVLVAQPKAVAAADGRLKQTAGRQARPASGQPLTNRPAAAQPTQRRPGVQPGGQNGQLSPTTTQFGQRRQGNQAQASQQGQTNRNIQTTYGRPAVSSPASAVGSRNQTLAPAGASTSQVGQRGQQVYQPQSNGPLTNQPLNRAGVGGNRPSAVQNSATPTIQPNLGQMGATRNNANQTSAPNPNSSGASPVRNPVKSASSMPNTEYGRLMPGGTGRGSVGDKSTQVPAAKLPATNGSFQLPNRSANKKFEGFGN